MIFSVTSFANAQFIEQSEAELVGLNFMETNLYKKTRSANNSKKVIKKTITKSYNDHKSYYKIIFEDGGFAIVSAIEEYEPILAYSLDGRASEDDSDASPAYIWWMQNYDYEIDSIIKTKTKLKTYSSKWESLRNTNLDNVIKLRAVTPSTNSFFLLNSGWGQGYPYNASVNSFTLRCGTCPTGCVATAIGQVMRYWGYPAYSFDWCNMPDTLNSDSSFDEINAVANLLADIGARSDMDYCGGGECQSGTSLVDEGLAALESYGYDGQVKKRATTIRDWWQMIIDDMDDGQPVLIRGESNQGIGGHAWVVDGRDRNDENSFHFNWGHSGGNDGFFYLVAGNEFNQDMAIIRNIQPKNFINCYTSNHVARNLSGSKLPAINGYLENGGYDTNESYRTIYSGQGAVYRANNSIKLTPGFTAKSGSTFYAQIIPCPCSFPYNYMSRQSVIQFENVELENEFSNLIEEDYDLSTTDLKNYIDNNSIIAYPNPTNDIININLGNNLEDIAKVELYNTNGMKFQEKKPTSSIETFEMQPYPQGMYIIKITFNNGESEHHKFIYK